MKNIHKNMHWGPCGTYIESLSKDAKKIDGCLSLDFGFMPKQLPLTKLPFPFSAWDKAVQEIPTRFLKLESTQTFIQSIPILNATKAYLPDECLARAATVVSILASAYWRHGLENYLAARTKLDGAHLPPSILIPWTQISERLHRGKSPYQSGYDLFLNNFKFRSESDTAYTLENLTLENLDVLTPSFGNEAERVFYISFVEIHAALSPIIRQTCIIDAETFKNDKHSSSKICEALSIIDKCIQKATKAIVKISPNPKDRHYCDPVTWSKTVAIFATPPSGFTQGGTSGASTPMLFVLDSLLHRQKYESQFGQYVKNETVNLAPVKYREFCQNILAINLRGFIEKQPQSIQKDLLVQNYNSVVNSYAGSGGFLDRHISKAMNYLALSTLFGRNQSISGHERFVQEETWSLVARDLRISMSERSDCLIKIKSKPALSDHTKSHSSPLTTLPIINRGMVARHHYKHDGWVIIDGHVYDLSFHMKMHPGGSEIIRVYLGREVSRSFHLVNGHNSQPVTKWMDHFLIGKLEEVQIDEKSNASKTYMWWRKFTAVCLRTHTLMQIQFDHESEQRQEILFRFHTYFHFRNEHLLLLIKLIQEACSHKTFQEEAFNNNDSYLSKAFLIHWGAETLESEELLRIHIDKLMSLALTFMDSLIEIGSQELENSMTNNTPNKNSPEKIYDQITNWLETEKQMTIPTQISYGKLGGV